MSKERKQLTVAELIKKLRKLPKDYLVLADGCDCVGPAYDVVIWDDAGKTVLVSR